MPFIRRLAASDLSIEQELWTYQDLVEHLLDHFQHTGDERARRTARHACQEAMRDLANWHKWKNLKRLFVLATVASENGTASYVHSSRQLTISAGSWPTWAAFGQIKFDSIIYDVEERTSATVLTLPERSNPGADLAAKSFSIFRSRFPLPVDFRSIASQVMEVDGYGALAEIGLSNLYDDLLNNVGIPGFADTMAVVEDPKYLGSLAIQLQGPPSTVKQYAFLYDRRPQPLVTEVYDAGTIAFTGGTATATGAGTAFTAAHKGCVLRVGTGQDEPTSPYGYTGDRHTPPAYQRIVLGVSGQTLTVDENFGANGSALKYTLSDPIDIEYGSMLTPLKRLAEWLYAEMTGGRTDGPARQRKFMDALDLGRCADIRTSAILSPMTAEEELLTFAIGEVNNG